MKINEAFRTDRGNAVLCWLATSNAAGHPNVSPKEIFEIYDDETLVIADIMSPNSVRNIQAQPKVCVSFLDVFRQKGFKVEGEASVFAPDTPEYKTYGRDVLRMAGEAFPVRHVIRVKIEKISRILAPSYTLFPDRSDAERLASTYAAYGVKPV